ncbi:MAG TPA: plastocyanin/azurin family copper-binding protein [Gemmatimonadota bacterium]|nr:plastocyanin/azurin family copper-binding protein [Gemmatimonadota bacterium]
MATRRDFLRAGGWTLAGLAAAGVAPRLVGARLGSLQAATMGRVVEIRMRSDALGSRVWFDPLGLRIAPGTTVRWVLEANVHSATAYHPDNGDWASRIPAGAEPWDSGMLTEPGQTFERRLDVPGVYDYYCIPHEMAGMIGRIVVMPAGASGAEFQEPEAIRGLRPPSHASLAAFPSVEAIVRNGSIRAAPTGAHGH